MMNVTLRQMKIFVVLAETLHFTRAAALLQITQSSVSAQIKELEQLLGLRLFDRHTRMLRLTDAGREMLPLAIKAVDDLETVIDNSSDIRRLRRGRVSIAVASLHAALVMPSFVREYAHAYPGVRVVLHDVPQKQVLAMVSADEVDFGIGSASVTRCELRTSRLWSEEFVAVMQSGHPLASRTELTWHDLRSEYIIGPSADNPLREQLDSTLACQGIALKRSFEVSLPLTMVGLVHGGLGIGIMTTSVTFLVKSMGLVMRRVVNPSITREVSLVVHPDRSLSPAALAFRSMLEERCQQLPAIAAPSLTAQDVF